MSLDARNAAAMRSAQLAYDSASDPRAEIDDDPVEVTDEDRAEAYERLLVEYDDDDILEASVEALALGIAREKA